MMKISKALIITCLLLCFLCTTKAQTITINFKDATKYGSNPHYFDNSGCGLYNRFGPNPTPLNGYNIRTVGNTWISDAITIAALNMYASGKKNSNYYNSTISVEYPFKANKTYKVELNGIKDDQVWMGGTTRPSNFLTPVLWLKLDNNPEIISNAQNKCIESHYEVEKKVDRYSILIADENKSIGSRNYTAKFSPLEDRNSIKITYDPSPADPNFQFDGIFRLTNIKITELPYEEEIKSFPFYYNVPIEFLGPNSRNNPLYQIDYVVPNRKTDSRTGETTIDHNFTISTYQWLLTDNIATFKIPNLNASRVNYLTALGNIVNSGRTQGREQFNLPNVFENNNLTYEIVDGDLVIKSKNDSNTAPVNNIDFNFMYTIKK